MGTKVNQVSRVELFVEIAKALELETSVTEENNALSIDVSKGQLSLKVIFGDFKKVRIWKKFAFAPRRQRRRCTQCCTGLVEAFFYIPSLKNLLMFRSPRD